MSERDRRIYRRGQIDTIKMIFGCACIAVTFAAMFGQAFMW